jgi:hypothetical protein
MIKTFITNELLKSEYFKDMTMDLASRAKARGKVDSDLRDRT